MLPDQGQLALTLPCRNDRHASCAGSYRDREFSHLGFVLQACECRCHAWGQG